MAIRSMTGFGSASRSWPQAPGGSAAVSVELRAVNSRFLEVKVRQPFGVATEHALRKQVEGKLGRGRIDVSIALRPTSEGAGALAGLGVDPARLELALEACLELSRLAVQRGLELLPTNPVELLRFSSMTGPAGGPATSERVDATPPFLAALVDEALAPLVAMREAEGAALRRALGESVDALADSMQRLRDAIADQGPRLHARLQQRVEELCARVQGVGPDRERLAQEVALVVAKADVGEELARIDSHLAQVSAVLDADAQAGQGKTLEFLAQELLREVTTIGGKIVRGGEIVIEAKGLVGRIREQVQNVE